MLVWLVCEQDDPLVLVEVSVFMDFFVFPGLLGMRAH